MRRAIFATLFALGAAVPAAAQDAPAPVPAPAPVAGPVLRLGSRDAASLAVRRDLSAAAARAGREAAIARTYESRAPYDPLATLQTTTGTTRTESGSALGGAPVLETDEQQIIFGLSKTFGTGTNLRLDWVNRRSDSNSTFASFSPQWSSSLRLTFLQPLLRDFGLDHHDRIEQSAALQRRLADLQLRQALADVALAAEEAYWNLVLARANLAVAEGARELAVEELRLVEAQRAAGRLAPVDVLQSRAGLAAAEEVLIVAETAAATAADQLVRLVAPPERADDLQAWAIVIETSESVDVQPQAEDATVRIATALRQRPAVLAARVAAENAQVQRRLAARSRLPRLDLTGSVSTEGLGRNAGDAGQDLGSGDFLGWSVGVQVEVPLWNTLGSSRQAAADAGAREQQLRLRDAETRVVLDVRTAVRQLDAADRRIAAAQAAREFSERKLAAERDRLQQGLSTAFLVSRAREDLSAAQTRESQAKVDYHVARARLRRADGSNLQGLIPDRPE